MRDWSILFFRYNISPLLVCVTVSIVNSCTCLLCLITCRRWRGRLLTDSRDICILYIVHSVYCVHISCLRAGSESACEEKLIFEKWSLKLVPLWDVVFKLRQLVSTWWEYWPVTSSLVRFWFTVSYCEILTLVIWCRCFLNLFSFRFPTRCASKFWYGRWS